MNRNENRGWGDTGSSVAAVILPLCRPGLGFGCVIGNVA